MFSFNAVDNSILRALLPLFLPRVKLKMSKAAPVPSPGAAAAATGGAASKATAQGTITASPTSPRDLFTRRHVREGFAHDLETAEAVHSAVVHIVQQATDLYINGVYDRLALRYVALSVWEDMTRVIDLSAVTHEDEAAVRGGPQSSDATASSGTLTPPHSEAGSKLLQSASIVMPVATASASSVRTVHVGSAVRLGGEQLVLGASTPRGLHHAKTAIISSQHNAQPDATSQSSAGHLIEDGTVSNGSFQSTLASTRAGDLAISNALLLPAGPTPRSWSPGAAPPRLPCDLMGRNIVPLNYRMKPGATHGSASTPAAGSLKAGSVGSAAAGSLRSSNRRRSNAPAGGASGSPRSLGVTSGVSGAISATGSQRSESPTPSSATGGGGRPQSRQVSNRTGGGGTAKGAADRGVSRPDSPTDAARQALSVPEPTSEELAFARQVAEQQATKQELLRLNQSMTQQIQDMCKGGGGGRAGAVGGSAAENAPERFVVDALSGKVIPVMSFGGEGATSRGGNDAEGGGGIGGMPNLTGTVPKFQIPSTGPSGGATAATSAAAASSPKPSAGRSQPRAGTAPATTGQTSTNRRPKEEGFFQPEANTVSMVLGVAPSGGVGLKEADGAVKRGGDLKLPKNKMSKGDFRNTSSQQQAGVGASAVEEADAAQPPPAARTGSAGAAPSTAASAPSATPIAAGGQLPQTARGPRPPVAPSSEGAATPRPQPGGAFSFSKATPGQSNDAGAPKAPFPPPPPHSAWGGTTTPRRAVNGRPLSRSGTKLATPAAVPPRPYSPEAVSAERTNRKALAQKLVVERTASPPRSHQPDNKVTTNMPLSAFTDDAADV